MFIAQKYRGFPPSCLILSRTKPILCPLVLSISLVIEERLFLLVP